MSIYTQSAAARRIRLKAKLRGACHVRKDILRGLYLAWFGDRRVIVFAEDGMTVSFWRVRTPRRNPEGRKDAYFREVVTSIDEHIRNGDYPGRVPSEADDSDI